MVTSLLWLFCVSVEKWPSGERVMTVRKAPRYRSLEVVHSEGCRADWAHCAFICVIYPWSGGVESKTSLIHYRLIEMKYSSEACPFLHWLYMFESINDPPYNPWDQGLDEISTYLNFIGILFHTFSILSFILKSQLNAQCAQFCLMYFKPRYSLNLLRSLPDVCMYWGMPDAFS